MSETNEQSASDAARLSESALDESESIEHDEVGRAELLDSAGAPQTDRSSTDGLGKDEQQVLDHQLLHDATTPPPDTDADAIADEEGEFDPQAFGEQPATPSTAPLQSGRMSDLRPTEASTTSRSGRAPDRVPASVTRAEASPDTADEAYAQRLRQLSTARWKQVLNAQAPYRWKLRRHDLGRTLDVGCGIGRNLAWLPVGSVGVDHNPHSVATARAAGLTAMTTDELASDTAVQVPVFDSLLFAHVLEHLTPDESDTILQDYLPYLRPGGKVLVICPQERGYDSDATHVTFLDALDIEELGARAGLVPLGSESFPLPRFAGKAFTYNETHVRFRLPA